MVGREAPLQLLHLAASQALQPCTLGLQYRLQPSHDWIDTTVTLPMEEQRSGLLQAEDAGELLQQP